MSKSSGRGGERWPRKTTPKRSDNSGSAGLAEVELNVELLPEEVGAAFGVAQVFRGVATGGNPESDRTTLKRSANGLYALAMRVVEAFSDAE